MQYDLDDYQKENILKLRQLLKKCRSIVGHFNHSDLKQSALLEKQIELNINQHKLIQDVSTRWNSSLAMIERIIEQRTALNAVFSDCHKYDFIINENENKLLLEIVYVLTPFKAATDLLSGSKYVTASLSLPIFYTISNHIKECFSDSETIKSVKYMLNKGLELYSHKYELKDNNLLVAATFLDPKYKKFSKFNNKHLLVENAEDFICRLVQHIPDIRNNSSSTSESPQTQTPINPIDMFSDATTDTMCYNDEVSKIDKLKAEIYAYKNDPTIENVLVFWSQRKEKYPYLFQIARIVLCTPASSVPSEELFSHSGYQIWDRRNKLNPLRVNKIMFLYENYSNNFMT